MFGHASLPSVNYTYGAKPPAHNAAAVDEQLVLAHRYRNRLCELELARRGRVETALAELFPAVVAADEAWRAAESELTTLVELQRNANSEARRRTETEESKARIAAARKASRVAYQVRRAARSEAFESAAWVESQERIQAEHYMARKLAASESGLYWSSYLLVGNACKSFSSGAPPRFARQHTGSGTIAVQLQGGRTFEELNGMDRQIRIQPFDPQYWSGHASPKNRYQLWFRVGSEGRDPIWTVIPFRLHRPFPEGSRVKWVYLTKKSIGPATKWEVRFTLSSEEGFEKLDFAIDGAVAIDAGWRLVRGGLRVAYWFGSDGQEGELIIPDDMMDRWKIPADIASIRDQAFNAARTRLADWLDAHGENATQWLRETCQHLRLWKSATRLYHVVVDWRSQRPADASEIFHEMDRWARNDRELWRTKEFKVLNAIRWRREQYRLFAAELSRRYATACVEDTNWKKMQDGKPIEEEGPNDGACIRHRRIASPGILHEIIRDRFRKTVKVDAKYTTMTCDYCGQLDMFNAAEEVYRTCRHCGETRDQDARAARNLLARAKVLEPVS